jgi:hypothetical protein
MARLTELPGDDVPGLHQDMSTSNSGNKRKQVDESASAGAIGEDIQEHANALEQRPAQKRKNASDKRASSGANIFHT